MATVKGNLIKDRRKQQKLTQKELASGICKQATISNIESRNYCYSIEILSLICSRLNLQINDVIIQSEEVQIRNKLNDVQKLCNVWKNDEALKKYKRLILPEYQIRE